MNTVLLYILLSFPLSFAFYIALVRNISAHVRDLKDYLSFFIHPFGPQRMLILHKLGGEYSIYYDDQIREIKGEKQSEVFCRSDEDFDHFIVHGNLGDYSVKVSAYDARGPKGYDSPFSMTWRWVVGASFLIYLNYLAMVEGWIPGRGEELDVFWAMLGTMAFFISLTWYLINIVRLRDETTEYIYLLPKGIARGLVEYIHAPEPLSNLSVAKFLRLMGREIVINVPEELKGYFERLKKDKKDDLVSALSLVKFFESYAWKGAVGESLKSMFEMQKAGETVAQLKLGALQQRGYAVLVIAFVIGLILGFLLGNTFSFGFSPETGAAANSTYVPVKPATPPTPPGYSNVTGVVPATPPPPPILGGGG